jgi:hypothetical protein
MAALVPVHDAVGFKGDALKEQIDIRRTLRNQCVGWLYRGILEDELHTLQELHMRELYPPPPKDEAP